jgi:hypothetical protein
MEFSKGGVLIDSRIVQRSDGWRQCALSSRRAARLAALLIASVGLSGCGWYHGIFGSSDSPDAQQASAPPPPVATEEDTERVGSVYVGTLAADDPQAVEVGRQILLGRASSTSPAHRASTRSTSCRRRSPAPRARSPALRADWRCCRRGPVRCAGSRSWASPRSGR